MKKQRSPVSLQWMRSQPYSSQRLAMEAAAGVACSARVAMAAISTANRVRVMDTPLAGSRGGRTSQRLTPLDAQGNRLSTGFFPQVACKFRSEERRVGKE